MARRSHDFQLSPEQQKMAADNINLARREAWRIQRTTGIDYGTLEGAAFLGLCKACYRYDPESGYKFSSLATPTIRGELLHWVRDRTYAMRLSHRMRENWIKGRKLLYGGASDIEVAEGLGMTLEEWQETRSACSGPPLELKDQSMPSEPLEPDEIDFQDVYKEQGARMVEAMTEEEKEMLSSYFNTQGSKPPVKKFNEIYDRIKNS